MFRKTEDFLKLWEFESKYTLEIFEALTDESLSFAEAEGHRDLGRMAWHITDTLAEMPEKMGIEPSVQLKDVIGKKDKELIKDCFLKLSENITRIVSGWDDTGLDKEDEMYGETWKRGSTLLILILHQAHHRGQMTVLMRQAGLKVPGIYGPAKEQWADYGMPAPAI